MKKNKKHYWNYRIITKMHKPDQYANFKPFRSFSIAEVHYDLGKPNSYGDESILQNFESLKDLKWTMKKNKIAFKKPILDVDNSFKKYKHKKLNKNTLQKQNTENLLEVKSIQDSFKGIDF